MSDNDKDATVAEEPVEQEMDMSVSEPESDTGFDKTRQQLQQEIGNKVRPLEAQIAEIKELIREKNTPKDEGEPLDDDDYLTAKQARAMAKDLLRETQEELQRVKSDQSVIRHKADFQSQFVGVDYDKTLSKAFDMARDDNPGMPDEQLAIIAGSYMKRLARGNRTAKPVEPDETPKKASKKAPDSAKGAKVVGNTASVSGETVDDGRELTPEEINEKYGF